MKKISKWIWYYGDFEIYHSLKMQTRREEYDYMFPPFWHLDDCYHNVKFQKEVQIEKEEVIIVYAKGVGMVEINQRRCPFETYQKLTPGRYTITIYVTNPNGLPCAFVDGTSVNSDDTWSVSHYGKEWVSAGCMESYSALEDDPLLFKFAYKEIKPVYVKMINDGVLYDFGKETFAKIIFGKRKNNLHIFYGESSEEAIDLKDTYLRTMIPAGDDHEECKCRAFRYLFFSGASQEEIDFKVYYEYLPVENKSSFQCSDEIINKIWETSVDTFHLNCREFYLDGIKRDRWVWSGDAYQSYFLNRYSFFDTDIAKRTILALRGKDPIEKHMNTIMDYSFYWIMSIYDYYEMTGDVEFLKNIYSKMESLMEFCISRLDKNGFAAPLEDDWIFIDWATIDKTGPICAEQILLLRSMETMVTCGKLVGADIEGIERRANQLKIKINEYFWNVDKGAYIDSFESGKENVTRHANIFALLFGYADEKKRESIIKNVLENNNIDAIRTPYFKFYELDAWCNIGELYRVTELMKSYWGGMLQVGATSFWEEFNSEVEGVERYKMYADKFGKSLCHAWGASPLYILGKYYLGVKPTSPGYATFEVKPDLGGLSWMEGIVPVGDGTVSIAMNENHLSVTATRDGGTLILKGQEYVLGKDREVNVQF